MTRRAAVGGAVGSALVGRAPQLRALARGMSVRSVSGTYAAVFGGGVLEVVGHAAGWPHPDVIGSVPLVPWLVGTAVTVAAERVTAHRATRRPTAPSPSPSPVVWCTDELAAYLPRPAVWPDESAEPGVVALRRVLRTVRGGAGGVR